MTRPRSAVPRPGSSGSGSARGPDGASPCDPIFESGTTASSVPSSSTARLARRHAPRGNGPRDCRSPLRARSRLPRGGARRGRGRRTPRRPWSPRGSLRRVRCSSGQYTGRACRVRRSRWEPCRRSSRCPPASSPRAAVAQRRAPHARPSASDARPRLRDRRGSRSSRRRARRSSKPTAGRPARRSRQRSISARTCSMLTPGCGRQSTRITHSIRGSSTDRREAGRRRSGRERRRSRNRTGPRPTARARARTLDASSASTA